MSNETSDLSESEFTDRGGSGPKRTDIVHGLLLIVPALVALAVHHAGTIPTTEFALNHQNPAFYQFYTSAFVHASTNHLVSNLVGYTVAIVPLFALYVHQNSRQEFRGLFVAILLLAPLVASIASYSIWTVAVDAPIQYDRGFSGVVSAFAGLLFMQVLAAIDTELPEENANYALLMLLVALFGSWAVTFGGLLRIAFGGAIVATLAAGVLGVRQGWLTPTGIDEWMSTNSRNAVVVSIALAAALLLIVVSFPAEVQNQGGFTNLVGHGAGFFLGMAIHYYQSR